VNIRFLIALAAILFSALPSLAQTNEGWDARFFPTTNANVRVYDSSNVVYASDVIISQMIYAVNERYVAATKINTWDVFDNFEINYGEYIRRPEVALAEVKQGIKNIASSFVRSYSLANFSPDTIVYYNRINILFELDLPADFFEVTPVRNLMGNSSFSTNAADYGWDGAYRCLNLLTTTFEEGVFARYEQRQTCSIFGAGLSDSADGAFRVFDPPDLVGSYSIQDYAGRYESPTNINAQTLIFDYGRKTYRSILQTLFNQFPHIVTNSVAQVFEVQNFSFDIYPSPGNFAPRGFTVCPPDYAYALPNQEVAEDFTISCVSNTTYSRAGELVYFENLVNNQHIYPLPEFFTEGEGLRCSAQQILAAMTCYVQFEEFEQSIIIGCDGSEDIYSSANDFKSAQTESSVNFDHIVTWGFQYK
jgi:hypothetical protein